MKKLTLAAAALLLLCACGSKTEETTTQETTTPEVEVVKKVGTAELEIENHGSAEIITVEVTLEDDKVTAINIDETYNGQTTTKKTLKEDYGMVGSSGIGKEWYEQCAFLEEFIVANGVEAVTLTEEGKAEGDLATGCTISLGSIKECIDAAVANAK